MSDAPDIDLSALVEPAQAIAREAGRRILNVYAGAFGVTEKADQSPVTAADMASHDCILRGLAELTPAIPVLSEEAPDAGFSQRSRWEWLWLVDPLDGTREFIKRNDQFSVNIALIHRHEAVFGLVFIPVGGICYYALRGGGAYKRAGADQPPQRIQAARVCPYPARIISSLESYRTRRLQAYLSHLGPHRHLGMGGGLKSCLVAEGAADLYPRFGPTGEWDTAAAQVIVEQAGGHITDMQLRPLRYNARPILINPDFFAFGDATRDWSRYLPQRHREGWPA
ncbi:MAG: 3'(2'),5'-bisphosphate nucleotidase CysQ [Candidatus Competibacteraceae bacterium]|nr:3'(2'),5'-bisphosphate nucleotidase CysQ [Candidatus Competibacteraceae bacterium]